MPIQEVIGGRKAAMDKLMIIQLPDGKIATWLVYALVGPH